MLEKIIIFLKARLPKNKKGFTLIEMVIVLFIIALLLSIVIPNANKAQDKADAAVVKTYETEEALYKMDKNVDAVDANTLVQEGYLTQDQVTAYQRVKR
ncbi:competence type IV pilus major pilin ComGC [Aerococcus vaginalis]